jgi:simple sugar transport system substrate-binding protein
MPRKASLPLVLIVTALCFLGSACDRDTGTSSSGNAGTGPTTATAVSPTTSNTVDATGASTPAANQVAGGATTGATGSLGGALTKKGGGQVTVGFSQIGAESAWRTAETQSVKDEAAKRGVNLRFSDAQGKQENQIAALRSFITQRVDAIILAPQKETGWDVVLRDAKRANIPVVLVDRGISGSPDLYATLIASDFVAEGRMAGEWLAKATNGQCNIAELQGTTGAAPAIDRAKGFREAIAKYPGMKIIEGLSQTGDFTRAKGKDVMQAFLKSPNGGQIQAVYAHNDDMALGAIQAIEEAGKKAGTDIKVVSIDGGKAALDALAAGKINCSVECSPRLGPQAFDAVQAVLNGQTLPKQQVVKDRLFDATNVQDVLARKDYWE